MRPYIVNLTDQLIGKNNYDTAFNLGRDPDLGEFVSVVKGDLLYGDVRKMNSATLGKIMCSFEVGDVLASREELLGGVYFAGDCEEMLRELVSICLAYAIRDRFVDSGSTIPRYKRKGPLLAYRYPVKSRRDLEPGPQAMG